VTLWVGDLEHFEAFARTLTLDNGRRMSVEPFQRTILSDYFRGARETLVLIPKKNGKTTLMAALLVYHLCFVDEARAYLAASSVKQAGLCYDMATGFVARSAALQRRILARPGTKELRSKRDTGTAFVLAADADTADGVGPTLFIVDELHRAKSTGMYDVARDGLDARGGSMLAITTAGDDEDSPLGVMRGNFLALPGKRIRGRYTYARSRDRSSVMHEWALRPDDDLEDLELVKSVNPLRSMTKGKLRRRRDSPTMTLGAWARFACNVWTQGEDVAIATVDWARRARSGLRLPDGAGTGDKVLGVDLGWSQDTTGLVVVGYPRPPELDEDGELVLPREAHVDERLGLILAGTQAGPPVNVRIPAWLAELDNGAELERLARTGPGRVEEGRQTDEDVVKGAIVRLWLIWPDLRFALDPNAGGQSLAQWIERELAGGDEERVATLSQQPAPMQGTSMHFAAAIRTRTVQEPLEDPQTDDEAVRTVPLYHPDRVELNAHVRAAAARWNGERWRFDKRRKPRAGNTQVKPKPIDLVIASALAYRALMSPVEEELEPFGSDALAA
jgi:hypothetical protein